MPFLHAGALLSCCAGIFLGTALATPMWDAGKLWATATCATAFAVASLLCIVALLLLGPEPSPAAAAAAAAAAAPAAAAPAATASATGDDSAADVSPELESSAAGRPQVDYSERKVDDVQVEAV